jgi:hypothetical protein
MSPMNPRLLRPLARFQAPPADPFATLVSTKSTGNVSGTARSTTGYIKVEWWDSTSNVYGTGVAGNTITWSKAAGGAGSKTLRIYPSDASGNLSGSLTNLICSSNSLTSLNVSGLTALTQLICNANSLTAINVSGLTALTNLTCSGNSLTALDVSGLTALVTLLCNANALTALDVSGLTALANLYCNDNSLTSLNVSGLTALVTLYCNENSLTSLDVSGLTALNALACNDNSLTSLRAVGVVFDAGKWKNKQKGKADGIQYISGNLLSGEALNQFYTDLGATTPGTGFLEVGGNPGTTTDDPTIATNKGYVVFGS